MLNPLYLFTPYELVIHFLARIMKIKPYVKDNDTRLFYTLWCRVVGPLTNATLYIIMFITYDMNFYYLHLTFDGITGATIPYHF